MHSIRILVGPLPASVREAVTAVIGAHGGLELVGVADRPSEVLAAAGDADVVVLAADDGAVPGVASHLLDQYRDLLVLALLPEDRGVLVHALRPCTEEMNGIGPTDLATVITDALFEDGRELP